MLLISLKAQTLINVFNHLHIIKPVHMEAVNYVFRPLKGGIYPGDPMGINPCFQANKEIDKETDKLDISVYITKIIGLYTQ